MVALLKPFTLQPRPGVQAWSITVAIDRASVRITATGEGAAKGFVVVRHPDDAAAGDTLGKSVAVGLSREFGSGHPLREVAAAIVRNDGGSFPWVRAPGDDPQPDAAEVRGGTASDPAPLWHVPGEPGWRRFVRTLGPWWLSLGLALLAFLGFMLDRKRGGRVWHGAAASVLLGAALGFASDAAVRHFLPPPVPILGEAPAANRVPPDGHGALYLFGESTMGGQPFHPPIRIHRVVEWCFEGRIGDRPFVSTNFARGGWTLDDGEPAEVYEVLAAPARFRPVAILGFVGHNVVSQPVREGTRRTAAPSEEANAQTEARLRALGAACREAGVPLILAVPWSNVDGLVPHYSLHDAGVSEAAAAECERLCEEAEALLEGGDEAGALRAADAAVGASPGYALGHYLRSRALRALGRMDAAPDAAWRAVELDGYRDRAPPSLLERLRAVCASGLARCVDLESDLRTRYGALDERLVIDAHHPTELGYYELGLGYAAALSAALGQPMRRFEPRQPPPELVLEPAGRVTARVLSAQWWISELLQDGPPLQDARSRRYGLARAGALLDAAEGQGLDEATRGPHSWVSALLAALSGDGHEARRLAAEALREPVNGWVAETAKDPESRELLEGVGVTLP